MSAQEQRALTQSSLLCLVPFALGLLLWGLLPEELVFGFGPFALLRLPKVVAVILVPLVLAALHVIVTLAHSRRTKGYIFGPARMSPWLWAVPAARSGSSARPCCSSASSRRASTSPRTWTPTRRTALC